MLRGKKPSLIEKRFKALFYGKAGVGKTMAAIQFPKPYLIDTERGAVNSQYIDLIEKNEGVVFQSSDFDDVLKEIKTLLTVSHGYKTLIIDPLTIIYNDLLEKSIVKLSKNGKDGTEMGRHYGEANKHMKHLLSLLLRLDMNVIITSHAKNEYGTNLSITGQTFDCYKKLDYLFDLVLMIEKKNEKRVATIEKTRLEKFPEKECFNFSYEEISKRYDEKILEKESKPEILATENEVSELERLINLINYPEDKFQKWLTKAGASSFDEMPSEDINKCIDYLKSKITTS